MQRNIYKAHEIKTKFNIKTTQIRIIDNIFCFLFYSLSAERILIRLRLHYSRSVWKRRKKLTKRRCVYTAPDRICSKTSLLPFTVATRPRFLNVVERKRSATHRCVNTVTVNVLLRFRYQSVSMCSAFSRVI